MNGLDITKLVYLAREGNKEAFGQLIERYQAEAQRLANRMVFNAELARDLTQEAFLQAYLSLAHLQDISRFNRRRTRKRPAGFYQSGLFLKGGSFQNDLE
jgi:DNA-directed RNA polymerase specialized sigma24 family protein